MWPEETRGGYYLDVSQLADEAASAGDQPHAIAAILLYQQLVEEMLYLIDYSTHSGLRPPYRTLPPEFNALPSQPVKRSIIDIRIDA